MGKGFIRLGIALAVAVILIGGVLGAINGYSANQYIADINLSSCRAAPPEYPLSVAEGKDCTDAYHRELKRSDDFKTHAGNFVFGMVGGGLMFLILCGIAAPFVLLGQWVHRGFKTG